jgi:two-component system CheB/CheR fusion protein
MRSKKPRATRPDSGAGEPTDEIVEALPHGLLLLDGQLRVRRSNTRYCELLATTMEDVVGRPLFELSNGLWDVREVRALVEDADTPSVPASVELEREPLAGSPRFLRVHVRRVKGPASDRETFFVFTVEDATPNGSLPASRDPARDRDELIARAAHELRGPLGSMANWAHLLSQGSKDGALQLQGLAAIHRALKAATQIVDELHDVALLRAGKLRLRAGLVDLLPIVDMAIEKPRSAAKEKGVKLEVVREVPTVAVMGDPDRLQQILLHLLANAVRHTPAGGRIEIAIGRDGTGWRLSVSDTGQGIAREALPRIFEGRSPVSPGAVRSPAGLGVGLTIVRHLAELHGGSVEASSPGPGLGARFVVRLPVPALAPSGLSPDDGFSAVAKDHPLLPSSRIPGTTQAAKPTQGVIPGA